MATKFVFLILPEVHLLDLAGPDQAIHEAMDYGADFKIEYCGNGQKVKSSAGLSFGNLKHYTEIKLKKGDFLIIPGVSYDYLCSEKFNAEPGLLLWIEQQFYKGIQLCSICMGAFVLAETGLLDGRNCTTHFKKTVELQKRFPKIRVVENILYTAENGIYTSAGIASGIDLILYIIEQLKGSHFAHLVARELVVYNRRNANDSQQSEFLQFRNHIHSGIHKVQDYLLLNLEKRKALADLSDMAGMSERNFTRIFKKETGTTVNDYINSIRVQKAEALLRNPDLSKIEVANKIGLQSTRQLDRILKEKTKK